MIRTLLLIATAAKANEIANDIRTRDRLPVNIENLPNGIGIYTRGGLAEATKTAIRNRYTPKPRGRRRAA